jgi:hypothetical protein
MIKGDIQLVYEYDRWANNRVLQAVSVLSAGCPSFFPACAVGLNNSLLGRITGPVHETPGETWQGSVHPKSNSRLTNKPLTNNPDASDAYLTTNLHPPLWHSATASQ